jgi:hypothetical protein
MEKRKKKERSKQEKKNETCGSTATHVVGDRFSPMWHPRSGPHRAENSNSPAMVLCNNLTMGHKGQGRPSPKKLGPF